MPKFYDIDPKTCSPEELKKAISDCHGKVDYYGSLEQGCKRFINSVYGALACKFYQCANVDIAESITLQGQDLIKYSVRCVNALVEHGWHKYTDLHKKIAEDMKKEFGDSFNEDEFLRRAKIPVDIGDRGTVQIYGDSCSGNTMISLDCGNKTIESLYNEGFDMNEIHYGKDYRSTDCKVKCYDGEKIIDAPIKWIIRHRTCKPKYRIYVSETDYVEVTGDHSMIIFEGNEMKVIKPAELFPGMIVMTLEGKREVHSVSRLKNYDDEYVYDIEVDTKDSNCHNFFGNGILIHNTDSISEDSLIRTELHPEGISIKDFYNENIDNAGDTTLAGHESANTTDKVLNWNDGLYYGDVKRIIRHKVSKPKWKLKTSSGKEIECTSDHSLVVFRDGKKIHVKPSEIIKGDKVLIYVNDNYDFMGCDETLCVGEYNDEYVYDIEMDDETHTFIANDILVHNSAYITLDPIIRSCGITNEQSTYFILSFNKHILSPYFKERFEAYADHYNCPENLEEFELEKIARSVLMQKKKKYVMDISWKEPDVHVKPLHSLLFKGVEVVKGTSSLFCRTEQRNYVTWLMDCINNDVNISYALVVQKIKEIKKRFEVQDPNEITMTLSLSDYDKYVLNDKSKNIVFNTSITVPYHAKAAARYNNALYNAAKKYRSKYQMIHSGDKVKVYYIKGMTGEAFAFLPNNYPLEFAPPMDMDEQFKRLILDPLNRYNEALGLKPVTNNFTYSNPLW